jgi:protein N-terminal amidase
MGDAENSGLSGQARDYDGGDDHADGVGGVGYEGEERRFNALVVVGPDGTVLTHYHKSFLYCVDKTWAHAGGGFVSVPILSVTGGGSGGDSSGGERVGEVLASLGICMDINPREFEAPWWGAPVRATPIASTL